MFTGFLQKLVMYGKILRQNLIFKEEIMKKIYIAAAVCAVILTAGCQPNVGENASSQQVTIGANEAVPSAVPTPQETEPGSEPVSGMTGENTDVLEDTDFIRDIGDNEMSETAPSASDVVDDALTSETAVSSESEPSSAEDTKSETRVQVSMRNFAAPVMEQTAAESETALEVPEQAPAELSEELVGWGLGKNKDPDGRPTDAVAANEKYGKYNAVFVGDTGKVTLTFDEGYENGFTPSILDTLKKENVKATFYVTYDYCKSQPDLVRRMIAEGHTLGNHSYTHASFPTISDEEVRNDIMKMHEYVKQNFNYDMKVLRFPKGEFSEKTLKIARDLGYKTVFWSMAYRDWERDVQPDPAETLELLKEGTHPGEILLLHAVSKTNAVILPELIRFWKSGKMI